MITIYGTVTSPFVRRVRVLCLEKALPHTLVSTADAEGTKALQALSPIAKVPVAVLDDGAVLFDSRQICDELCKDGRAPLREPFADRANRVAEENAIAMIDDAVLALVRRFYLQKDNAPVDAPYLMKDHARARTTLLQLNAQLEGVHATAAGAGAGGFGFPELALVTALDWIQFRNTFDLSETPRLQALCAHWGARASLNSTRPGA
jgi:glutathione S-transferase